MMKYLKAVFKRVSAIMLTVFIAITLCADIHAHGADNESEEGGRIAIERMIKGFENFEERIDISDCNITPDKLSRLFSAALKNSPYLFYVDNRLTYTFRTGGNVVSVSPRYNTSKDEAEKMTEYCKNEVKKISDMANGCGSVLEKILTVHDIICRVYKYDTTLKSNNIYTFLKYREGTCQGYTWTYMAVLRELGIECEYVASDTISHIWVRVKVDGEWYHSDVTWDDPVFKDGNMSTISRKHFLFSDKKADADGYKDRYSANEIECTSEKYDSIDFSVTFSTCSVDGDITHDGCADLYDLICLKIYSENGDKSIRICPICSDVDMDLLFTNEDIDLLRDKLLTNPVE